MDELISPNQATETIQKAMPTALKPILPNLRHLRFLMSFAESGSQTQAAVQCGVTQPAIAQAITKLERTVGVILVAHPHSKAHMTAEGDAFLFRARRAVGQLDPALEDLSPRLVRTATWAQLDAVLDVSEARSYSAAGRRRNLAQPTLHRAVRSLEREAKTELFEQTTQGLAPTRKCVRLVQATRLAKSELTQAKADLAELDGHQEGQIVIGALPLSRSAILPHALRAFRSKRTNQPVRIVDGPYSDLLNGLRSGGIDFIIGALRSPCPSEDVQQETLFDDNLTFLAGPHHKAAQGPVMSASQLAKYPWIVPRKGSPTRTQFDRFFVGASVSPPESILECGSILLMRSLLLGSDMLGCISESQANAEISNGLLSRVPSAAIGEPRAIGLTVRSDWAPTRGQADMIENIRIAAKQISAGTKTEISMLSR